MRWALAVVVVVLVAGGALMLGRSRGGGSPAAQTAAEAPDVERAEPLGGGGGSGDVSPEERRALAELRAEMERAEPVAYRTDEQRLEDARAWVGANRPADHPYNELEARMLALMDAFMDGEKRSALWTLNMSEMEVEMIRAMDADGDGQVSDDEVELFADEGLTMLNPMEHPYLRDKLDTDGDGTVGAEEMGGFATVMADGALAGVFERGKADAWDGDNDGFVTDTERVAGEQAAREQMAEMFGEMGGPMAEAEITPERRAELVEQMGEETVRMLEAQREMMVSQAAAMPLLEAMRLDDMEQPDPAAVMQEMPPAPDMTQFDADGDGAMSETETAAQQLAMQEHQAEVQRWSAEYTAQHLRKQFEHSAAASDQDGDGRMAPWEWDERLDGLLSARDARLFLQSYDLDESGRVEAGELSTYLQWFRNGSLRADVNFDGAVDGRDLEEMATGYQRQGR